MDSASITGLFAAGIATFFSPCVLPLIPIYLSILVGAPLAGAESGAKPPRGRLIAGAVAFVAGFSLVFIMLGLAATSMGALLNENRAIIGQVGGVVVMIFGLKFLGLINIPFLDYDKRMDAGKFKTRFAWLNNFLFGVFFSFGWTPCVGPVLGTVLTYTAASANSAATGAAMLAIYSAGFAVPLLAMALFIEPLTVFFDKIKPHLRKVEYAIGVLLLIAGLMLFTDNLSLFSVAETEQQTLSEQSGTPKMIAYVSKNCTVCNAMIPTLAALEHDCRDKKVVIEKRNISEKQYYREAIERGVRGVPTFIFYDGNGAETARLVGQQKIAQLRETMATISGESCCGYHLLEQGSDQPCESGARTCAEIEFGG
jgi:cytochrome c-type biogenesis protein